MKVLDTLIKQELYEKNAQKVYFAYNMRTNIAKYQCTSARVYIYYQD